MKRLVQVSLMCLAVLFALGVSPAQASDSGTLLGWINRTRAHQNLPPVTVYADLTDDAENHAADMARQGTSFNHPSLQTVTSGYARLVHFSERSRSLAQAFQGALHSPQHRSQIYGDFDYIGIGVVRSGGYYYICWFLMDAP